MNLGSQARDRGTAAQRIQGLDADLARQSQQLAERAGQNRRLLGHESLALALLENLEGPLREHPAAAAGAAQAAAWQQLAGSLDAQGARWLRLHAALRPMGLAAGVC